MKSVSFAALFLFVTTFIFNTSAHAKGIPLPIFFGEKEEVHKIMGVELEIKEGEELFLGYKTHSYFFLAGIYLKDDGYVLGIEDRNDSYYSFPTEDVLKMYQTLGILPKELPEYSIPLTDYLIGYSLWLILLLPISYRIMKIYHAKRKDVKFKEAAGDL